MTNEEAIRILRNAAFLATSTSYQAIEEAVEVATKALTSATDINVVTKDGEVIYRQQAIDIIEDFPHGGVWNVESMEEMVYRIKQLPSAQSERKRGKWIDGKRMKNDGTFYWFRQCDQCGYERNDCDTEKDSNFCPDCGADMRQIGEHDGER